MKQQNKFVKGEYIIISDGIYTERIEIEIRNGFVVAKNESGEILLNCTPNKSLDPRGVNSIPKYRIMIEIEAIN